MAYTQEQINAALTAELAANPNLSKADLTNAGKSLGLSDAQINAAFDTVAGINAQGQWDKADFLANHVSGTVSPQWVVDAARAADLADLQSRRISQTVTDASGKVIPLSAWMAGFDPNNPTTQIYLGELAAKGGQDATSQYFNQIATPAQKTANAAAWATELARLQEIDRQNALNAQQGQQAPQGLLDTGRQANTQVQTQVAKTYSPAEVAAYNAYRSGDIAGVNRAIQQGNLTAAQVKSSFGLSDADMNWMINNAGVKFATPTTATTTTTTTTGTGTTVGNKTYTQAETDLYNAYRAGNMAEVNRLLAANKWTGADIKSKFGLTDADIAWITNNAGGKFYNPNATTNGITNVINTIAGGQTPAGQFRELFPSFEQSKQLAAQTIANRPTTQQIVNMISNPQNPALTSAWQNAEKTGQYGDVASMLQNMPIGKVQSAYGLSNADMQYIMSRPEIASALAGSGTTTVPAPTLNNVLGMISK
jgi:hypothetical protein